jgi:thiol-disulfide isomerase/thioredoxin
MLRKPALASLLVAALAVLPALGATLPRKAPELIFQMPGGAKMSLDQFKGKVIVLEFLLTTCPHCKRTASVMQKLYGEYGPKGVQMLGLAFNDEAASALPAYTLEAGATYPIGYTDRDRAVDFLQHPIMLTMWVPQLVFIDREGNIVAQYPGTDRFFLNEEANIRSKIEQLLRAGAAANGNKAGTTKRASK